MEGGTVGGDALTRRIVAGIGVRRRSSLGWTFWVFCAGVGLGWWLREVVRLVMGLG